MSLQPVILKVENLSVHFKTSDGTVQAVRDISFQVRKGQTVGIVGESGSGKSVTSLSIMDLLPKPAGYIAGGQIEFESPTLGVVNLNELKEKEIRKVRGNEISMIFQEPMTSLNPVFTCGAQVMEAILIHQSVSKAEAKTKTLALFDQVQLPDPERIFKAYPHEISGGQKQRVMIAMAMSCNPSILIADEPTTALDVTVQKTILELMAELKQKHGMSIIFITHDLGVISEIADEVLVMYKGKIVEQGPVQDIFNHPKHPYTKGLLACRPRMDVRLRTLPTISDFMEVQANDILTEKVQSVSGAIQERLISVEEYRQRQTDLAKQTPILKVENLQTWFSGRKSLFGKRPTPVKAVDSVSFEVFPGETLGLVGESGCGKTTLGRTILRLQEPTAGKIWYKGKDLTELDAHALREMRKQIQIIFQDPYSSLNPRITIGNAILEPMQVHGLHGNQKAREERVKYLLDRVSLGPEHFHRYPHEFSGGQRQRICIARALAVEPEFVICDESVSALDVSVQAQVLNLLLELRREFNLTYIFISHDLSVVKFMSDRMIVMNKGKIEEMGQAEDIYANPTSTYTQALIAAIPG